MSRTIKRTFTRATSRGPRPRQRSCRNHGSCGHCLSNRTISTIRLRQIIREELRADRVVQHGSVAAFDEPIFCEHANEAPNVCRCPPMCWCNRAPDRMCYKKPSSYLYHDRQPRRRLGE